jgi:outer membrane protein TolC
LVRVVFFLAGLMTALPAAPASDAGIPTPLTLGWALAHAGSAHPELDEARAVLETERARRLAIESREGTRLTAELVPALSDPAITPDTDFVNDSRASLFLNRQLYDFGRSRALRESSDARVAGAELLLGDAEQRRRLAVMRRFFDVLIADLRYRADDELMSYLYVQFDHNRHRSALGALPPVELERSENAWREALDRRALSTSMKANTRAALAMALDRPGAAVSQLARPRFGNLEQATPDVEETLKLAAAGSERHQALRHELEAAERLVEAEGARRRPTLAAELEANAWERDQVSATRDELRAQLRLRWPLYQGGEDTAALAEARALVWSKRAQLRKAEYDLRARIVELTQLLDALRVRRQTARQREKFRDLAVDRARASYELEERVSLGDAQARLTEAQWLQAEAEFETAMAFAYLDALSGRPVPSTVILENEK